MAKREIFLQVRYADLKGMFAQFIAVISGVTAFTTIFGKRPESIGSLVLVTAREGPTFSA